MKQSRRNYSRYPFAIRHYLLAIVMLWCSAVAYAGDFSQQRWQFNRAQSALQANDLSTFQQLSASLQDYPLYYYLRYQYLNPRLLQVPASEVYEFLKLYGNSAYGNSLRQVWLKHLAEQSDWVGFMQAYAPQKDTALQCYSVQARLFTKQSIQAALAEAKELWLVGKAQPAVCEVAFDYLSQSPLWSSDLAWQRIRLAMRKGNLEVANSVAKRLSPTDQAWVARWQAMHKNPVQLLNQFNDPDTSLARDIILHGIKWLAKSQLDLANNYWNAFQRRYAFTIEQIGQMQRDLALASIANADPQALAFLTAVNKNFLDEKFNEIRIEFALKRQSWRAVEDFITEWSEKDRSDFRWRYWLARAMEQNGKTTEARQLYKELAKERDYYGFLAADRAGTKYQMRNKPIAFTPAERVQLMKILSIAAAYEFYQLGMLNNARQEWQYAMASLQPHLQAIAAAIASRWGWYSQAILTATKAEAYDDLEVRFPLPFKSFFAAGANSQAIDLAWVYGVARQESVFMTDARSRSGALGLMQLMPATAKLVAKQLGIKLSNNQDILEVSTNISLGTSYLRQLLDKFDGNHMLATAGYNAGPGRAKRWAEDNPCISPDLWVEMIPFDETRTYVRRVLFYTRVFEDRLGQPGRPLRVSLSPYQTCPHSTYGDNGDGPKSLKTPG